MRLPLETSGHWDSRSEGNVSPLEVESDEYEHLLHLTIIITVVQVSGSSLKREK